uniref:Cytochrome c biogenesis protein CcsA n=1 Tax=Corynoplastis japonica TaxID=700918 RepID=A0A1X9PU43_9RHOD|nr:cytochrome c biogenesis protein [Corynoplastis japonica]
MNWVALEQLSSNIAFIMSILSMFFYWFNLTFSRFQFLRNLAKLCAFISLISITYILSCRWIINHYFPLSNLYESLLFLSWGLIFIQVILEQKLKNSLIGSAIMPLVMFTLAFASLSLPTEMQKAAPLVPALKSNWLMMHVSIMILSYATLMIGSLLSILFLVITKGREVSLKGSSTGYNSFITKPNYNLSMYKENMKPSDKSIQIEQLSLLESIDNLSYRVISLGFPLLTIGIISGAVWANEAWGSYWSWDPKETWALITWIIFAAYLHTRLTKAWQGRKPAILASIGFVIVWVCYLGVNFIGKGLHNYGWIIS